MIQAFSQNIFIFKVSVKQTKIGQCQQKDMPDKDRMKNLCRWPHVNYLYYLQVKHHLKQELGGIKIQWRILSMISEISFVPSHKW